MSTFDTTIVVGAILVGLMSVVRASSRAVLVCAAILAALCVMQIVVEGFYWQFVPVYLVIAVVCVSFAGQHRDRPLRRWILSSLQLGGIAMLMGCWIVVPVPALPAPTGAYPIGTAIYRWVDTARVESATESDLDRRNIVVQAWYPAATSAKGSTSPYIDGLGRLPGRRTGLVAVLLARYDRIDTHAVMDAEMNRDMPRWPVVLFSPGYGASRSFYTTLLSDLASRGFVVLAVDHPYEAAVTQLVDGTITGPIERFGPDDQDRVGYMDRQTQVRTADLRSVLNALDDAGRVGRMAGRLARDRIAAIGHSFGGAAAVSIMASDARVMAAANIDGTMYGALPDQALSHPFLLIQSDYLETGHGRQFIDGHARLASRLRAPGFRYEIGRANHYSFTDAPMALSPPARWVVSLLLGGSRGTTETVRVTNDLLVTFLRAGQGNLTGAMKAVADRYSQVSGKLLPSAAAVPAADRPRPVPSGRDRRPGLR